MCFANIFYACLFTVFTCLLKTRSSNSDKVQFIKFSFVDCSFVSYWTSHCLIQGHWDFLLRFLLKVLHNYSYLHCLSFNWTKTLDLWPISNYFCIWCMLGFIIFWYIMYNCSSTSWKYFFFFFTELPLCLWRELTCWEQPRWQSKKALNSPPLMSIPKSYLTAE